MEFLKKHFVKIVIAIFALIAIKIISPEFVTKSAKALTGPICQDNRGKARQCYTNSSGKDKYDRPTGTNDCQTVCR